MNDDAEIQRAVRRTVGIAALRRIRRIVDADSALEVEKSRWVRRFAPVLFVAVALVLAWIVIR